MATGTIKSHVQENVKTAMKAKDKETLAVLRLIMAEFKRIEVDERIELDEARELSVLDKMQKQRRDSISQFKAAGRDELAAKEQFEMGVIASYMPEKFSDEEIQQMVQAAVAEQGAASIKDMAKVMAQLKPKLQGRADMGKVSSLVKSLLS